MPQSKFHLDQARKNEEFFRQFDLATSRYFDWAVTALFYSALHYLDACLHEHRPRQQLAGYHPETHEQRTPLIGRNFPRVYRSYRELKDRSEDARYLLKPFTPEDVRSLEQRDFTSIKSFARSRLNVS